MSQYQKQFQDKSVLVTGASLGIGRAIALAFAKEGAKVMVSDVKEEEGHGLVKELKGLGTEAEFFLCDVSNAQEVKALVEQTVERFGSLDVACNNAGVEGQMAPIANSTEENWDFVMNINLKGLWFCLREQIPVMEKGGGGAIVNLSSVAGQVGFPGLSAYVASKHGVIGLTKTAALECAEKNIHVNAVCPGPILTPMLERLMSAAPGFRENLTAAVPQKRIGEVNEVAQAVLYLSREDSKYVTGQALSVDGGMVAQ